MSYQTPKWLMILRVASVPWKLILCLGLLCGMVPGVGVLFLVVAVVAAMMLLISGGVRLFGNAIYGNDPDYKKFRAAGGDPYFSLLPPPINNDSQAVRAGGRPEPQTEFVPPEDWLVQCLACGARNQDYGICWHCGTNLAGTIPVDHTPVVYGPRTTQCPNCRELVREAEFGKFEHGVICPYCQTVMQIIPPPPDPRIPPRTMDCTGCGRLVQEPAYGSFERGVSCPYCKTLLFAAPQAVEKAKQ